MPIYQFRCPECGHQFSGMVFAGTRPPEAWVCSRCGSDRASRRQDCPPAPHPLESAHASGCPCCNTERKTRHDSCL
ncbi:MAG: FmdB family zinc ribbon protein [Gammaproteobacteria bacterium]